LWQEGTVVKYNASAKNAAVDIASARSGIAGAKSAAAQSRLQAARLPGLHLIGDLYGCRCDYRHMIDRESIEKLCLRLVEEAGLTSVGSLFHGFGDNGGVTGMVVLAESHLSLHTWPEECYVTVDVYVCNYTTDNRAKARRLFDALVAAFKPVDPHVLSVDRA
jgi:S-adenosylmethionine decarboxylase